MLFRSVLALAASKNDRKIKLSLFDVSLAAAPELRSSYDLNDYWADFDGNYAAFAEDKPNRLFFLPSLKGGYIFSYRGGRIELKKTAGNFSVSRAVFLNGYLYLVTDEKIEVYGGPDWDKVKSLNL